MGDCVCKLAVMARLQSSRIDISIADRSVRVSKDLLADLVRFVAKKEKFRVGRIDLAIVPRREISGLNRRYLRHSGATDVLSFDLSDATTPGLSGQLVVCAEVAREQARFHGLKPAEELLIYVIHGMLHLAGYDDQAIRPAAVMHARQDELLSAFRRRRKPKATGKRQQATG
jgi:probable rRNA maturation factor